MQISYVLCGGGVTVFQINFKSNLLDFGGFCNFWKPFRGLIGLIL